MLSSGSLSGFHHLLDPEDWNTWYLFTEENREMEELEKNQEAALSSWAPAALLVELRI